MSQIIKTIKAVDTSDGEGIKLKRVFGFYQKHLFDPFLMLDHIKTSYPKSGFPWHPHRGIETITIMLDGQTYHEDSLGNSGTLSPGDIQWMKAASGILHQEIPDENSKHFELLQLWLNMPKTEKMDEPAYHYMNIQTDNTFQFENGFASVIAGTFNQINGPIQKEDRCLELFFFDFGQNSSISFTPPIGNNIFIYVLKGNGNLGKESLDSYHIYQLKDQEIMLSSMNGMKVLYASGKPLKEEIEWYGPIVMNTKEDIQIAKQELKTNTFIKHRNR